MPQHRDRQDGQEGNEADDVTGPGNLMPQLEGAGRHTVEDLAQRITDEAPLLVAGCLDLGNAKPFGEEAREANREENAKDEGVLGLGLDPDPIWTLYVTAHDRPDDAANEHQSSKIPEHRIGHVHPAMEELGAGGELVVNLEHGGHTEQGNEAEVDHAVHQARRAIAQQGAHVDPGPEIAKAAFDVLGSGAATVRPATLPVLHPIGKGKCSPHDKGGNHGVKGDLEGARNALKRFTTSPPSRRAIW